MKKEDGRGAAARIGDKLMNSKDRLLDMTRMADESDELTRNMNTTLLKDRENLQASKRTVIDSLLRSLSRMKESLGI